MPNEITLPSDCTKLGEGGFAEVFYSSSADKVYKRLKKDFHFDTSICSRFKREYEITLSLDNVDNIIKVYEFCPINHIYTMEFVNRVLYNYRTTSTLDYAEQCEIIRKILSTMSIVHSRTIIHRDISPTNIFFDGTDLKIADFGLGKDFTKLHSHATVNTAAFGQFHYCAPEQYNKLVEGDEKSDVYSLGRLINFIMTKNHSNYEHVFKSICQKATSEKADYRQENAQKLLEEFENSVRYHQNELEIEEIHNQISMNISSEEVNIYISELSEEYLIKIIKNNLSGFKNTLIEYMSISSVNANDIIKKLDFICYQNYGRLEFEDYDFFSSFSYLIITNNDFEYPIREVSAKILNYVAYSINRFTTQKMIKKIIDTGIEPELEKILNHKK